MNEVRRQAYLEVMGYDVWLTRPEQLPGPPLQLSDERTGAEKILMICEFDHDRQTPIARDIARSLGEAAVWGWPQEPGGAQESTLDQLIEECLFTEVIVFGQQLAATLSGKSGTAIIGSAKVQPVASLDELAISPTARRQLWEQVIKPRHH